MLNLTASIPEVTTHIIDPVAEQTIRKFIKDLGFSEVFKNDLYMSSDYNKHSNTTDVDNNAILKRNKFTCEVEPILNSFSTEHGSTNSDHMTIYGLSNINAKNSFPIFCDPVASSTTIIEKHMPCNLDLQCSVSFVDRTLAYEFNQRLINKYGTDKQMYLNTIAYDYKVPIHVLGILLNIYKLKELQDISFFEYLKMYSLNNINGITSRTNKKAEIIINKLQTNVLNTISFTGDKPNPNDQNRSPDTYSNSFKISVQFSRPHLLDISFPIVVRNKLLPKEVIDLVYHRKDSDINELMEGRYKEAGIDVGLLKTSDNKEINGLVQNPHYDEWGVPQRSMLAKFKYKPFFISLFLIDSTSDTTDIDLSGDLGGMRLSDEVINTLKEQGVDSLYNKSRFNISVFADNYTIEPDSLTLIGGTQLAIPNKYLDREYHIVISETKETFNDTGWTTRVIIYDIHTRR